MTKMKTMTKQYMMSVYDDGSIKLTERALTKRAKNGRFASSYSMRFRRAPLPNCCLLCPFFN